MSSTSTPTFAVVGRVNEGKSSIVAALTENESIAIGPEPGTTKDTTPYYMSVDGEKLFAIVDTPGFQEPEAAFQWLSSRARTAAERPEAIRAFLAEFGGARAGHGGRFEDECKLLEPVVAGASVLYVVDCSHPFRASYEFEMQILRWTGRPCFALLNRTGEQTYEPEWRAALQQYFNAVRPFNAQRNLFQDRLSLLTMLAELDDAARAPLTRAVDILKRRQADRHERAAAIIADALFDLVGLRVTEPAKGAELGDADKRRLEDKFLAELSRRESEARNAVEATYAHARLARVESGIDRPLFDQDILSEDTWRVLGQTPVRLITAGALGGAIVGGAIDAATLGHSFLTGTLIGLGLGGLGSAAAVLQAPEARVLGVTISGLETVVGPHRNPNFAWILLDRALLHFRAIMARSHAAPPEVRLDSPGGDKQGIVATLAKSDTARFESIFRSLRRGRRRDADRQELQRLLAKILPSI